MARDRSPVESYVKKYYTAHKENFTPAKVREIKVLNKTEQDRVIKIVEKRISDTEAFKKTKTWKVEAVLAAGRDRLVYVDQSGVIRARNIKGGRFRKVPNRFKTA